MSRLLRTRVSGLLLHPTSLPGAFGIGDLGPSAHAFVQDLATAGQHAWQVLPLGPTGYGDSPYQCVSAFAGNPLLLSLEQLVDDGWLTAGDVGDPRAFDVRTVDYPAVIAHRQRLWPTLLKRFDASASATLRERFDGFCRQQAAWLDDFSLYVAVKAAHDERPWTAWSRDIARREPDALARWRRETPETIRQAQLLQFLFADQSARLRRACDAREVEVLGDLPIFVAHDSADVWAHPDLFRLNDDGSPEVLTGVPPDYFSATGQLWGNPHYRWDVLAATGFQWWIARVRALLAQVHAVRIDHFRGFEAAWEVPGAADTARDGAWVPGPGSTLFEAMHQGLGLSHLPFVAENLGVITPAVEALRERYDLPGMAILQFAFGRDPQAPAFRPHHYARRLVVYTGTHDNDTTVGWWHGEAGGSTRTADEIAGERARAAAYFGWSDAERRPDADVSWAFIRAALGSVADTAIVPAQDLLALGSEARMNRPGSASGNWRWRLQPGALTPALLGRLRQITEICDRG